MQYIQSLKSIILAILLAFTTYLYFSNEYQTKENKRQSENMRQIRIADSLKFHKLVLSNSEFVEYVQAQNSALKSKLSKDRIKLSRIEQLISTKHSYKDTTKRETNLDNLVEAIKNSIPKTQTWVDSSKCQIIRGSVSFNGTNLKVIVNDRETNNQSDTPIFWERRQWKLLWFKTRFLGKKQLTSKTYDDCGISKTVIIEKKP